MSDVTRHDTDRETFQVNSAKFMVKDQSLEEKMGAYIALNTYLSELVTSKRAAPGEDILSDLARQDDLTAEELTGIAFLLLLAGHETTANMLALGTFALLEHPAVREALVVALGEGEEKRLAAYVTPETCPASELRQRLADRLPSYMVPSAFVLLPELPLTSHGKVDRSRLPLAQPIRPAE